MISRRTFIYLGFFKNVLKLAHSHTKEESEFNNERNVQFVSLLFTWNLLGNCWLQMIFELLQTLTVDCTINCWVYIMQLTGQNEAKLKVDFHWISAGFWVKVWIKWAFLLTVKPLWRAFQQTWIDITTFGEMHTVLWFKGTFLHDSLWKFFTEEEEFESCLEGIY